MAHKTRVNGTNYEISGGKTLVGGTAYSISNGKTLVGGTAYDISFLSADPVLENNTPATIQKITQNGQAENYWSIGDTIPIALNGTVGACTFSNETYYAFIIGFNHNINWEAPAGSVYSIHFQFGKTSNGTEDIAFVDGAYNNLGSDDAFRMNTSKTNLYGWEGSYMRTTICPAFLSAMPTAWQNVIKSCTKYSDNYGGADTASKVTATSDKIWLLAEFEVFGVRERANSAEQNYQQRYPYYANGVPSRWRHSDTETGSMWWLRSASVSDDYNFLYVKSSGSVGDYYAHRSKGFAPGFMVG